MKKIIKLILVLCIGSLTLSCETPEIDVKPKVPGVIIDLYESSLKNSAFKNDSIIRFTFDFEYESKKYSDLGILMFPKGFKSYKKNKLVVYCHSGGGYVNETNSEVENQDYPRYLVSLGYVVLDVNGIPDDLVKSKKIDVGRTVGNPLTLKEYVTAINLVINKFLFDKEAVYLFSNSNGGAIASNIVNLTDIKIKAQAGICPLLSIKENAWNINSGKVGEGEFPILQNRANIIRLYGMKDVITLDDLKNAKYEEDKVGVYDPFEYLKNNDSGYKTYYKIYQPKDDWAVSYDLSLKFADYGNRNGDKIFVRSFDTGGHTPEPQSGEVGEYSFNSKNYRLTPTVHEVAQWFEEHDGYKTVIH